MDSGEAKAVIRGLGGAADFDRVFVNNILVRLGVALFVVDVPVEGFEQGVDEFAPDLGFVVRLLIGVAVQLEALDQIEHGTRTFQRLDAARSDHAGMIVRAYGFTQITATLSTNDHGAPIEPLGDGVEVARDTRRPTSLL